MKEEKSSMKGRGVKWVKPAVIQSTGFTHLPSSIRIHHRPGTTNLNVE